jgi:hypothetical protein
MTRFSIWQKEGSFFLLGVVKGIVAVSLTIANGQGVSVLPRIRADDNRRSIFVLSLEPNYVFTTDLATKYEYDPLPYVRGNFADDSDLVK